MSKGHTRSNREVRKPKQSAGLKATKAAVPTVTAMVAPGTGKGQRGKSK